MHCTHSLFFPINYFFLVCFSLHNGMRYITGPKPVTPPKGPTGNESVTSLPSTQFVNAALVRCSPLEQSAMAGAGPKCVGTLYSLTQPYGWD